MLLSTRPSEAGLSFHIAVVNTMRTEVMNLKTMCWMRRFLSHSKFSHDASEIKSIGLRRTSQLQDVAIAVVPGEQGTLHVVVRTLPAVDFDELINVFFRTRAAFAACGLAPSNALVPRSHASPSDIHLDT